MPTTLFPGHQLAVACLSATTCIAGESIMAWTTDANSRSPHWTKASTFGASTADVFSCPSSRECFSGDTDGHILSTSTPTSALNAWSSTEVAAPSTSDPSGNTISGISCPTSALCVAVDWEGNSFTSSSPTTSSWRSATVAPSDQGDRAYISCPSATMCAGVNAEGYGSFNPTSGVWTGVKPPQGVAPQGFNDVSCPSVHLCLATISDPGSTSDLMAGDPANLGSWHTVELTNPPPHGEFNSGGLAAISCPSLKLCVAVGGNSATGVAYATSDPAGPGTGWRAFTLPFHGPTSVACSAALTCVVSASGSVITGNFASSEATQAPPPPKPAAEPAEQDPGYAAAKRYWLAGATATGTAQDQDWKSAEAALQQGIKGNADAIASSDLASLQALPLNAAEAAPERAKDVAFLDSYFNTPRLYG